jgi:hypothetical protein
MKRILFILVLITAIQANAQITTIVTSSEAGTKIYVDGQYMVDDKYELKIRWGTCANVKFEKEGFLSKTVVLCNDKYHAKAAKTHHQAMIKDEAYEASMKEDVANTDIEISTSKKEADAWKLLSQIIMSYFDILETHDINTGYLRTAWTVQSFNSSTVRTRIILKQSSSEPLKYKIKICSEISDESGADVKKDEKFKEWDRILRKYEPVVGELQSRLQ